MPSQTVCIAQRHSPMRIPVFEIMEFHMIHKSKHFDGDMKHGVQLDDRLEWFSSEK